MGVASKFRSPFSLLSKLSERAADRSSRREHTSSPSSALRDSNPTSLLAKAQPRQNGNIGEIIHELVLAVDQANGGAVRAPPAFVSLVGYGVYTVWVTAKSRKATCDLAERMW